MSYASVADADLRLAYDADWLALSEEDKQNHLVTAVLWLNSRFVYDGCIADTEIADTQQAGFPFSFPATLSKLAIAEMIRPQWPRVECCTGGVLKDRNGFDLVGIPAAVRSAQILAAAENLSTPLFSASTTESGGLKRKKITAGRVSIEKEWEQAQRGKLGELVIPIIDTMMGSLADVRGAYTGRMVNFF